MPGSFAYFDLESSWWKTFQASLLPSHPDDPHPLDAFLESFPRAGMTRNGTVFRRRPLVPLKRGSESSSSPTMSAQDAKNCTFPPSLRGRDSIIGFLMRRTPTLRASETDQGEYQSSGNSVSLSVKGLVKVLEGHPVSERTLAATPTLTASAGERGGRGELTHFMKCGRPRGKITPTLTAAGDRGPRKTATKAENGNHSVNLSDVTAHLSGRGGGVLNPRWCEWYMGFPDGWCDLPFEDSATA